MARFKARVLTKKGSTVLSIDAPSLEAAEKVAKNSGKVLSINKVFHLDITPGLNPSDRYTFMVRLSSMVGSKVGTAEALKLIATTFSGQIKKVAQSMLFRVEAGMDIPQAMEHDRKNFPATTTALVRAGTQTGETWKALRDAAEFEYQLQSIRKGSMKDMATAIGSFLIAGALMIGTTEYFGPMVTGHDMFANSPGVDVDWIAVVGKIATYIMMLLLFIFAVLVWLGTMGKQIMPNWADAVILRIPFYKDLILSRNNYVTLYKLGLLIQSGVRIEEALGLTAEGAPRGALKTDLLAALAAVRTGRPWASVMKTLHATDRAALVSSTNREDIARTLNVLGIQYRDLYIRRMASFSPVLQMIAVLFMALAGGVLFGLTILPMLQMAADMSSG